MKIDSAVTAGSGKVQSLHDQKIRNMEDSIPEKAKGKEVSSLDQTGEGEVTEVLEFLDTATIEEDSLTGMGEDSLDDFREWEGVFMDTLAEDVSQPLIPRDIRTVEGNPEVLRDVLLYRKQVPVTELAEDSLGRPYSREAEESPLNVSFWKSPVNFKGYRRSGTNLVLYGIYAIDSVRFFRLGSHLYMEVMQDHYLITETSDYKHLIKVSRQPLNYP